MHEVNVVLALCQVFFSFATVFWHGLDLCRLILSVLMFLIRKTSVSCFFFILQNMDDYLKQFDFAPPSKGMNHFHATMLVSDLA